MAVGSDWLSIRCSFVRKTCVAVGWNHASVFAIAPQAIRLSSSPAKPPILMD